jgi:hypothetical protein
MIKNTPSPNHPAASGGTHRKADDFPLAQYQEQAAAATGNLAAPSPKSMSLWEMITAEDSRVFAAYLQGIRVASTATANTAP